MGTYNHRQWDTPERRQAGLVLVLPGIDGLSWCTRGIVRGLAEAGISYALEIHDWTFGILWALRNLRDSRRQQAHVRILVHKIGSYQAQHPGRPVFMIGHSAGAAMTILTLEKLPPEIRIEAGILLAPALSLSFDVSAALTHTTRGVWNFHAWGDIAFLGALTTIFGTVDGRHGLAAGLVGFRESRDAVHPGPRLYQVPYRFSMLKQHNLAGHFGCVNHRFVREWVAPLLREESPFAPRK
jgi:pimeloyl-ACP methyl ester carboxylesterase